MSGDTVRLLLRSQLRDARDALVGKVDGLGEEDRRRPMTPTGTNLIGLIKHLTWIEGWYLCEFFGPSLCVSLAMVLGDGIGWVVDSESFPG